MSNGKKKIKVSIYGNCKCSACGQTATSATVGSVHEACKGESLPPEFHPSLRGRLILKGMVQVGIWEKGEIASAQTIIDKLAA